MAGGDDGGGAEGARRRSRLRLLVIVLVLLDAVVTLVGVGLWLWLGEPEGANGVLHGSRPPARQQLVDLSDISGIEPRVPAPAADRGRVVLLVATCIGCRSGDLIGGFLGRLGPDDVPERVRMRSVVWGSSVDAWRERWRVPERVAVHRAATGAAAAEVRKRLGVGESGIAFVYDAEGRWRSTFHLGQLDRGDLRDDLELLVDEVGKRRS